MQMQQAEKTTWRLLTTEEMRQPRVQPSTITRHRMTTLSGSGRHVDYVVCPQTSGDMALIADNEMGGKNRKRSVLRLPRGTTMEQAERLAAALIAANQMMTARRANRNTLTLLESMRSRMSVLRGSTRIGWARKMRRDDLALIEDGINPDTLRYFVTVSEQRQVERDYRV